MLSADELDLVLSVLVIGAVGVCGCELELAVELLLLFRLNSR